MAMAFLDVYAQVIALRGRYRLRLVPGGGEDAPRLVKALVATVLADHQIQRHRTTRPCSQILDAGHHDLFGLLCRGALPAGALLVALALAGRFTLFDMFRPGRIG